jgi:hypothetical protein
VDTTPVDTAGQAVPARNPDLDPAAFLTAAAALAAVEESLGTAPGAGPERALASLALLREVREQLTGWETGLIEAAREAGASWADLAQPLGVASRQAAERRYLRLRPGTAGTTGEQRVQAIRNRRAADRSVTAWARDHAADLRRLAGRITALADFPDLPAEARIAVGELDRALADDDAASLIGPLAATRRPLQAGHPELAARVDAVIRHTDQLRRDSHDQRGTT